MNLNNEIRPSQSPSIEALVRKNGETMSAIEEVPYQQIFYAVPKEWLLGWKALLELAVQFQPTLYEKISLLATQEELRNQQVQMKVDLGMAKEEMLNSIKDLKKQDGNLKEEFFSKLSAIHSAKLREIRDEYARQKKETLRFMLITIASSAVLSALVSGLFLLLGG